ncbi:RsfS/YbeB/iojap family protein, partial [Psychrobacter sp. 1U2]
MINTMNDKRLKECLTVVENTLEDMKAKNITVINVEDLTDVMERIVIAEGTSKRHVRAMADSVGAEAKQADF